MREDDTKPNGHEKMVTIAMPERVALAVVGSLESGWQSHEVRYLLKLIRQELGLP